MTDSPADQLMAAFARYDAKRGNVPNQPKTPARSVRVADPLWAAAQEAAAARGETVTDVLVRALQRYVKRHQ